MSTPASSRLLDRPGPHIGARPAAVAPPRGDRRRPMGRCDERPEADGRRRTSRCPYGIAIGEGLGRRGAIGAAVGSLLLLSSSPSNPSVASASAISSSNGSKRQFPTPSECVQRLRTCREQLDGIASALTSMAEGEAEISNRRYRELQGQLHQAELGRFWTTARCVDQYIQAGLPGERGALARDEADLFALLPEKAGPISKMLKPNWDNPDDPLCLVYSCVNDPGAPPSINMLYALKLLHVGLGIAAGGDKRATPEGLLSNVTDAVEKLTVYTDITERAAASLPGELLSPDGTLAGGALPPPKADSYGPSPLG